MDARARLRPWLASRLDEGLIDGLCWVDKEKGIFRIPWKHHSKNTWTEDDAAIFKDWAVVTGRYRYGLDEPDWPMWKTRLRCALNKAPDIEEVKQHHDLHCDAPFKVYRFISKSDSQWKENATRNASFIFDGLSSLGRTVFVRLCSEPETDISFEPVVSGLQSKGFILLDSSSKNLPSRCPGSAGSSTVGLSSIDTCSRNVRLSRQPLQSPRILNSYHPPPVLSTSLPESTFNSSHTRRSNFQRVLCAPDIPEPEYHQIGIRIHHLNVRVKDCIITNPNGCCIYVGRFEEIVSLAAPEAVEVQIPHHVSDVNKNYVDVLLESMVRGVILHVEHGSIYAERMCKCAVFLYVPTDDGEYTFVRKLGRRERELIFDFDKFMHELQLFRVGHHPKPQFEMVLAFGQLLRRTMAPTSLLVWCRLASCRAWYRLNEDRLMSSKSEENFNTQSLPASSRTPFQYQSCGTTSDHIPTSLYYSSFDEGPGANRLSVDLKRPSSVGDPMNEDVISTLFDSPGPSSSGEHVIEEMVGIPIDDQEGSMVYDSSSPLLSGGLIVDGYSNVNSHVNPLSASDPHKLILN